MYDNVTHIYHAGKGIHEFGCWLGHRFNNAVNKVGYAKSKQKYIFHKISASGFSIHEFFLPDLRAIIEAIINDGSYFDVNLAAMDKILTIINEAIQSSLNHELVLDREVLKKEFKYDPLPAQEPAYEAYTNIRASGFSRGMLLDGAVGVGKTYISLSLSEMVHSSVLLIIAPLPTINRVWLNSLSGDDCLYKKPRNVYHVGKSGTYKGQSYILCHYENMKHILPLYKKHKINFSTLIVDEAHNFNDMKSTRTSLLVDIVETIPFQHTIPMSGTPIRAKASDLVPLFKIIYKGFNNYLTQRFMKLYRSTSHLMREVLVHRYKASTVVLKKTDMSIPPLTTTTVKHRLKDGHKYTIETIVAMMRDYVTSRTKTLEKDYPIYAKTYTTLKDRAIKSRLDDGTVTQEEVNKYEYDIDIILKAYEDNRLAQIPNEIKDANQFEKKYIESYLRGRDLVLFRDAKSVYKYISLKVQGEALANIVMRSRIDCYSALANDIDITEFTNSTVKKTLAFSNYTEVCDAVKHNAIAHKLKPIGVYGDTTKDLTKNVNIFINRKEINPLIATYKSLSTGVPLIIANVIVIFGLPHRQYILEQTLGRAWRTGQDKPVAAYIVELDTGDDINITDRDFDIIDFFREEVTKLTGKDDSVVLNKGSSIASELGVSKLLESEEHDGIDFFMNPIQVIKDWMR